MAGTHQIAVIGDWEAVIGFRGLGLNTYPVASAEEARQALGTAEKEGNRILFLTENYAGEMEEVLSHRGHLAILLLPDAAEGGSLGKARLRQAVVRAVGAEIL